MHHRRVDRNFLLPIVKLTHKTHSNVKVHQEVLRRKVAIIPAAHTLTDHQTTITSTWTALSSSCVPSCWSLIGYTTFFAINPLGQGDIPVFNKILSLFATRVGSLAKKSLPFIYSKRFCSKSATLFRF